MQKNTRKGSKVLFECPFCQTEITSSDKTEVLYRSIWIKGCANCYLLSIDEATYREFQLRNIPELL